MFTGNSSAGRILTEQSDNADANAVAFDNRVTLGERMVGVFSTVSR